MTDPKLHGLLDQTQFGDRLTLAHSNGKHPARKHTARISGPVLTDQTRDPSVGIDLLDGDPHIVRTPTGVVWAPVVQAVLHRGGEVIAKWDAADRLSDPEVRTGYLAAHAREVREQIASELIPVVAHKGRNDTDLSLLDEAAHRLEHGYSLDSNIATAVVRLIRNAIRIARKEQP